MNDRELVVAMLAVAGIEPSAAELDALVGTYPIVRGMVELVHSVEAARYETMCLRFDAEPSFTDWH